MTIGYYRSLTVGAAVVVSGPHAGYTWRFKLSDPTLKSVANGGRLRSDGRDVVFGSSAGLTTLYEYEQVFYDAVNGVLVVDVKIPSLSNSLVLYVGYADNTLTTDRSAGSAGGIAAWDTSKYAAVFQGGSLVDSTGQFSALTAIASPGTGTGPNGEAAWSFNGTTQYLQHSGGVPRSTYPMTLLALHKPTSLVGATVVGMQREAGGTASDLDTQASGALRSAVLGDLATTSTFPLDTTHWHLSAARLISSSATANNNIAQAHDESAGVGTPVISPAVSTAYTNGGALDHFSVGARRLTAGTGSNFYPGLVARASLLVGDPGQAFVQTVRNNQVANASFFALGAEQTFTPPGNPPTVVIDTPATGGTIVYGTRPSFTGHATPDTGRTINAATYVWRYNGTAFDPTTDLIPSGVGLSITLEVQDDQGTLGTSSAITLTVTQYPLAIDYAARPFDFVRNNTAFTVDVAAPDGTVVTMAKGPTSIVVATGNTGTISGINTGTITGATATAGAVRAGYARFSVTALLSGGTNSLSSIAHNLVFSNAAGNCASTNSAWFWPTPRASAVLAALATAGSGGVPGGIQILTSWTWVGSAGFAGNASTDTWGIPTQVFIPYNAAAAGGTARGLVTYQTGTGGNGTYSGGDALLNRGQPTRPILVSLNTGDQWNQVLKTGGAANTTASIFAVTPQGPSTAADFKRQLMQMYTRLVPFLATDYAVDTRKVAVSGYSGGADTVTNNIKDFVDSNPRFFSCAVINDGGVPLQTVAGTSTGGLWGSALVVSQDDGEAAWATGVLGVNGVGLPFLFLHGGLSDAQVSLANGTGLNGPNAFDPFGWWSSHSNLNTLICKDPGGTIRTYAERTVFYPLPAAGVVQVTSATSSKFAAFAICVDTATLPAGGNAFPAATGVGGQWFTNGTAGYASKLAAYAALDAGVVVPAGQTYVGASVIQLNSSNGGTFDPAVCTLNGGVTPGVTLSEWVIAGPVATSGASAPTMQTQGQVAYQIAGTQYVLPAKTTLFSPGAPGTLAGGGAKVIAASQYAGWAAFADASGTITTRWSADASGEDLAHRLIAQAASPAGTAYIASGVIKAGASGWTPGTDCFTGGSGTKPCSSFRTFYSRGLVNHLVRLGGAVDFTPNATVGSITTTSPTSRYGYAVTGVENVSGPDHSAQQPKLVATDTGIMAWIDNWLAPSVSAPAPSGGGSRRRRRWALERLVG